jgi:hypothetical protein
MMTSQAARWLLSALFMGTGLWYLVALAGSLSSGPRGRADAVGAAAHLLMSAAMVAMFWSWGARIPTIVQVTVFTAATAWFVGQVLLRDIGLASHRWHSWYHAAMMAAMVWMAVGMATMSTFPATTTGGAAAAMPGMAMAGMTTRATGSDTPMVMAAPAGWVAGTCVVLAIAFFATAGAYAFATVQNLAREEARLERGRLCEHAVGALMAAGMAVALLEMA